MNKENPRALLSRRQLVGTGLALGLTTACPAFAELRIEITGVGTNQLPIAIPSFAGSTLAPVKEAEVIGQDLERSGAFRLVELQNPPPTESIENPTQGLEMARQSGANFYVAGSIESTGDNLWVVKCVVYDTNTGKPVINLAYSTASNRLRMTAHRFADAIMTRLTGIGPMFSSKLAYVAQLSKTSYRLIVSDSDGQNPTAILESNEPIISPAWSPDGRLLAYTSFENRKPIVYVQDLGRATRKAVAQYPGNNSAPAFSPDGKKMAVALSRSGLTQIYLMNVDGTGLQRFTHSYGIDTEPVFSKDGKWIYFTSDRGGNPQIYRQPIDGQNAQRVTFNSPYAISPDLSADGSRLAYISKVGDKYRVAVMDLATSQEFLVTNSDRDESPSFAPNGRFLVYATEVDGRGVLGTCSADSRLSTRLTDTGDIREPAWGPIL